MFSFMDRHRCKQLHAGLAHVLSLIVLVSGQSSFGSEGTQPKASDARAACSIRKLRFPKQPVGKLYAVSSQSVTLDSMPGVAHMQQAASGEVTVKLPAGRLLMFVPDKYLLNHPEIFKDVNLENIDILNLQNCVCMDDSTEGVTDRFLKAARHSDSVQYLILDHSDVTDAGFASICKFPHLGGLDCRLTEITGSGFARLVPMKIKQLNLGECGIEQKYYSDLVKMTSLEKLQLRGTKIQIQGMRSIAQCRNLTVLGLRNNKLVNDQSILLLRSLSKLELLIVSNTSVTSAGLATLAKMPLVHIQVGDSLADQMPSLKKIFGSRVDVWRGTPLDANKDIMRIFEPLH